MLLCQLGEPLIRCSLLPEFFGKHGEGRRNGAAGGMRQCCSCFWGFSWAGQVSPRSWLGWDVLIPVLHPVCQVSGVVKGGKAVTSPSCFFLRWHCRDVTSVGLWQRAAVGPFSSPSPPRFGRVCGGTLPALSPVSGAGRTSWLGPAVLPHSQLLLWAGADGRRWRQLWVPVPPAAFPCIPGEEGWESHCLCLQQLHLLPACHLCPGAA